MTVFNFAGLRTLSSAGSATRVPPTMVSDVDRNRKLNDDDLRVWIKDLKQTWYGDANLDGEFNSSDLVQVFTAGWYEKGRVESAYGQVYEGAEWAEGDWNGDAKFGTSDLVAAFEDGGYEQGPFVPANVVPEPTSLLTLLAGLIGLAICRRHVNG